MLILCNVIVAFSVMFLMERIGRKVLLLISFGGMSFVMLFLLIGESLKVSIKNFYLRQAEKFIKFFFGNYVKL